VTAERISLWWGQRGATDRPAPGSLPAVADVVVVGAGLTGLCTAVALARAGVAPLVLEAGRAGGGTTGHTTAKVSLLQGSVLQRVRAHAGPEGVRAYVEANRAGQDWLLDLLARHDRTAERRTAYTYAVTEAGARQVDAELAAAREAGLAAEAADGVELPFPVRAATSLADQAQIDPLDAIEALRAELETLGGVLVEGVRVKGMSFHRPWTLTTTGGTVTAPTVILATQTPILDRSLHFTRLSANRSYAMAYAADLASVPQGMYLSVDDPARSLRTASLGSGDYFLVGGNGHPVGRTDSTRRHVEELDAWAREHFGVGEPAFSWSAQDYRTNTQLPSVGAVPGTDGALLVATGFDKWGMANAAASALVLTGDVLGEEEPFAAGLRADGIGLRDVTDLATTAAGVGAALVGDRAKLVIPTTDEPLHEGEGRVSGGPIGPVARSRVDGRVCSVSATCTHLGGVLSWNDAERTWDCPLHGSRFTPDGQVIEGPATVGLDSRDEEGR
jgi:glycine/D-amino acid oxidase-like deaminating enzyme/nitrite reductase/ring-hydroxylating ferredoxin subunit